MSAHLETAARVLERVRATAGPDGQAEVNVEQQALALTRFANSFIHQNVADDTTTVRLRLHLDGRTATGSTTLVSGDGLRDLVDRVVSTARLVPPDPHWPGLATPQAAAGQGGCDPQTAQATPDDRAARVRAFVDAAAGLETAGYVRTRQMTGAFANSAGQSGTGSTTEAAMDGIARHAGADGVARVAAAALSAVDGAALGARAAAKARASTDPIELPPGRYEVVLEPAAVADLLANLAVWGFSGRLFNQRRSFARLGEAQFDPSVTLVDDPVDGRSPSLPYDVEGTPHRRLVLVDRGVTTAVTHDRRTAAEAGVVSTGHAQPDTGRWAAFPVHLGIEPSGNGASGVSGVDGPSDPSGGAETLLRSVRRGILVTDLWYTRILDSKTLVVTGLTRNGVWLVEDGVVTRPLKNLRFTQSYPQALGPGAVLGVGERAQAQPESWDLARWLAPALHLASWNFTGGASG